MKQRFIVAALAVLALSAPAAAQRYEPGVLPPHEIVAMLRSTGFEPVGRPMRRGPNYWLRAVDENDRMVTLVISARSGQVMSATPVQTASRMGPGTGPGMGAEMGPGMAPGVTMGEWQRMPPGYVPPQGYRGGGPIVEEDDEAMPPGAYGARPPAQPYGAPPRVGYGAPPPAGGPLPPQPEQEDASAAPSDPTVIHADPAPGGVLPPPPERFPKRAATPPPKPVKRVASAPPKTAPLPKPKPAETAAPSAAPPVQAAPAQAAPPATSTPPAATDDTPN